MRVKLGLGQGQAVAKNENFTSLKDLETCIAPAYVAYSEFAPTHTAKKSPVCKEVENSVSYSESPL